MFGSHYAWIIFGGFSPKKIFADDSKLKGFIECSSDELKEAANRYISTIKLDIRQDNSETISGMVGLTRNEIQILFFSPTFFVFLTSIRYNLFLVISFNLLLSRVFR